MTKLAEKNVVAEELFNVDVNSKTRLEKRTGKVINKPSAKKMYQLATTTEQKEEFDNQWKIISDEMKNHYFPLHSLELPHLIKNESGADVGTVTFVVRNKEFSIVDKFFDFTPHLPAESKAIEVGKLSIKKEYRGVDDDAYLKTTIKCIFDIVRKEEGTHIIGTMNSRLFVKLRRSFGIPMKKLATVAKLPACDVYAFVCDTKELFSEDNKKTKEFL